MKTTKIEKIIKERRKITRKLQQDDIHYIIELVNEHPKWSVEKIFQEALKPKIRTILMLPLTPKIKAALAKAAKIYQISAVDVCYHVLEEWLKAKNIY